MKFASLRPRAAGGDKGSLEGAIIWTCLIISMVLEP